MTRVIYRRLAFVIPQVVLLFNILFSVAGEFQNHYEVLGITSTATSKEIKKAYRQMTLKYHPDKQVDKTEEEMEEAKKIFHKVTQAHDVLTNERLRRQFDEDLEFGLGDDSYYGSAGGAYSNIFEQERMERRRQRERNRRYGFFGRMDSITSYIYPLLMLYGLYNAMSNGGFSLSSLGDLPRYFGFDPSGAQSSGENTDAPCIGSDVMIHNIEKHPEFNGQQGKILSYAAEKQRYVIEFGENRDKKVALKPKNLKPLHILLGRFYMIDGLKNSSQYNGYKCKVLAFNNASERYNVQLNFQREMKQLALKRGNLVLGVPGNA